MQLLTPVHIPVSTWAIRYSDRLVSLGSCFSDHIAERMRQYYMQVEANPFGTLYNPVSIAHHMTDELLADKSVVMITFGTSWVYIDATLPEAKASGVERLKAVVDNCRKRPASDFIRYRLTVDDILSYWRPIVEKYADKRFIFTVSPIRHKKDGLHENQISKAILLQAIDELVATDARLSYFPSYEILLDELRDYRYYADDLVHPSTMAVSYIWERFMDTYLYEADTRVSMQQLHQLYMDRTHRPLYPDSAEYQLFARQIQTRVESLKKQYPWLQNEQ